MKTNVTNLLLASIGICLLFLIISQPASAFSTSTVYDNTDSIYGFGGWNVFENGNQITLAGTDRTITSFTFYYSVINGGENPFARVRFLKNDGISGKPNTILYDSGELAIPQGEGDFSYKINALNTLVPDTFTWSILFGNNAGIAGEGWHDVQALLAYPRITNAPTVGTWDNTWHFDSYMNEWLEDSIPPNISAAKNIFAANIEATSVPIPSSILLVASGVTGLACLKRNSLHKRLRNPAATGKVWYHYP